MQVEEFDFFIDAVVRRAKQKDAQRVVSIRSQVSNYKTFSKIGKMRALHKFTLDCYVSKGLLHGYDKYLEQDRRLRRLSNYR